MRVDTIPVEATRAFVALEQVYATLGLDVDHLESEAGQIGGTTQRLGLVEGSPPSAWPDCGTSVSATVQADSYDVTLTVASRVLALAGGSALETVVRKDEPRNVSGGTVVCGSLGTLELRIANLVLRGARRTR